MTPAAAAEALHRPSCFVCFKPKVRCVCDSLPCIDNRTPVWLIQHPRERFHAVGTARLLELSLRNFRLDVAWLGDPRLALSRRPRAGALLLYPGPRAKPLGELSACDRPSEIVVLDGTWHHARRLESELGFLETLPQYRLTRPAPSRYRIRGEPNAECVSTLEAVAAALHLLEPELVGIDRLLAAFDSMIDDQLRFIRARPGDRRVRERRAERFRALPRALAERFGDLVVTYAETAPGLDPGARRLVQWVALRVQSGELFEALVQGPEPPGLRHTRLDAMDLAHGLDPAGLRAAWCAFRRPGDLVAAWNQSTLDALAQPGLVSAGIALKGVYANVARVRPGTLEATLAREKLEARRLPLRGRAAERLPNAVAVATWLRERAK